MSLKSTTALGIVIGIFLTSAIFVVTQSGFAQDEYTGTRWEYRELAFQAPVSFSSTVGDGYFINGNFQAAPSPETTVRNIFSSFGNQGWELVQSTNNQFFIFKRQLVQ